MAEEKLFPQEMYDMFGKIAEQNNYQLRVCKTMLAGFKATDERDIDYMDSYMDSLYDFMDPASDTEEVYRDTTPTSNPCNSLCSNHLAPRQYVFGNSPKVLTK